MGHISTLVETAYSRARIHNGATVPENNGGDYDVILMYTGGDVHDVGVGGAHKTELGHCRIRSDWFGLCERDLMYAVLRVSARL